MAVASEHRVGRVRFERCPTIYFENIVTRLAWVPFFPLLTRLFGKVFYFAARFIRPRVLKTKKSNLQLLTR